MEAAFNPAAPANGEWRSLEGTDKIARYDETHAKQIGPQDHCERNRLPAERLHFDEVSCRGTRANGRRRGKTGQCTAEWGRMRRAPAGCRPNTLDGPWAGLGAVCLLSRPSAAIAEARKHAEAVVKSFCKWGAMPQIELMVATATNPKANHGTPFPVFGPATASFF